ncbi:DUF6497 family protein [Phaeovulum sp.]|uniref:DUF6497 family protein n=1 Tax=Phaeovulum sp. TaxID=2934796 RepID=UPI0039E66D67
MKGLGMGSDGSLAKSRVWVALMVAMAPQALLGAEPILVPSGQEVTLLETINDAAGPDGLTARFRFLAPMIATANGAVDAEQALVDMAYLCETYALPRLSSLGPQPQQIIISLADRALDFGATDSAATQYFEAYRPDGAACVWEMY